MGDIIKSEVINGHVYHRTSNPTIESLISKDEEILPKKRHIEETQPEFSEGIAIESASSPNTSQTRIVPTSSSKKSRKLQGVGIKKPLYTKYESLFIIKAYQKILEKLPNLILVDIFKIIALLFNKESIVKGFKMRTSDQLYQKYKRIQHGLNHGEVGSEQLEFIKFFRRNEFNSKEWIPLDFDTEEYEGTEDEDIGILKSITFKEFEESINEALNNTTVKTEENGAKMKEETDDELLELAGYKESHKTQESHESISLLEQQVEFQNKEIKSLHSIIDSKDQEILFLKNMIKEDLSYIRVRVTDK